MTKEELTKLLMEAYERGQSDLIKSCQEAASIAVDTAILAEREACANICETLELPEWPDKVRQPLAQAIRARGQA